MALLSFVESAPRAYRLKVGNADLFRNSTEPGTSPAQAPLPANCLKPKVFLGRRSIRQIRAWRKKFAAARAGAKAEFACAKG
jgi:hypothetical protein